MTLKLTNPQYFAEILCDLPPHNIHNFFYRQKIFLVFWPFFWPFFLFCANRLCYKSVLIIWCTSSCKTIIYIKILKMRSRKIPLFYMSQIFIFFGFSNMLYQLSRGWKIIFFFVFFLLFITWGRGPLLVDEVIFPVEKYIYELLLYI